MHRRLKIVKKAFSKKRNYKLLPETKKFYRISQLHIVYYDCFSRTVNIILPKLTCIYIFNNNKNMSFLSTIISTRVY